MRFLDYFLGWAGGKNLVVLRSRQPCFVRRAKKPRKDTPMSLGGKRPGAGAPRGNLNALKTGLHSRQLKTAMAAMLCHEEIRPILLTIIEKQAREREQFQALMLACAKFIHSRDLMPIIRHKLIEFLESEGAQNAHKKPQLTDSSESKCAPRESEEA